MQQYTFQNGLLIVMVVVMVVVVIIVVVPRHIADRKPQQTPIHQPADESMGDLNSTCGQTGRSKADLNTVSHQIPLAQQLSRI